MGMIGVKVGARRARIRVVWVLMGLVVIAALVDGAHAWRQARWNAQIVSGEMTDGTRNGDAVPPELRFARAHAAAARGADDEALQRYRPLQGETPLGLAARYNSANLLMRQALVMRAGTQPGQSIALIELAKEMYRDVLRDDPQHWNARYNLERAQRLLPDPEEALDAAPPETKRDAERAATTMRGYSPGLP